VSGDAAIAVIADRLFGKKMDKKKAEQSAAVEA